MPFWPRMLVMGLVAWLACTVPAGAENWPGWRGPRGDGTTPDTDLPLRWSADENIAWKVELKHGGHASPVVWDAFVLTVGTDEAREQRVLMLFDRRSGERVWDRDVLQAPLERKHKLNSWSSSTPATDGELIYVSFLDGKQMFVAAYDFQGRERWQTRPGVFSSVHGYCSSPVLFEELVIVNGDHDGDAYLVALERKSGKTVWKTPRENRTRSYCTPIIREIDGRTQMLLSGNLSVASYDPRDGSRHWFMDGPTEQFVASLVYNQGLLFVTGGFPDKHILAIDPTGNGNITDTEFIKWRHERTGVSYVPSPVAAGEYFYVVSDNGIGTCYEARSGQIVWQERMGRHYSASLLANERHVYFLDDDGITRVVRVGPKFEVVAVNKLGEATYASPAVSRGQVFVRGEEHLFCIGANDGPAGR